MKKSGLSPVIATVLLIAIAIVLAAIIFFWAKAFIGEPTQKFGEPIDNACSNIDFEAEALDNSGNINTIEVINRGNVPLFGLEVRVREAGSEAIKVSALKKEGVEGTLRIGESGEIELTSDETIAPGKDIVVVPIIQGENADEQVSHVCDIEYSKIAEVVLV
tara:strand:+ start:240 stop:725 length:486 start_codon:yes stop_codon:yes gene_type:complete